MRKSLPLIAGILFFIGGLVVAVVTTIITLILPESYASTARIRLGVGEQAAMATEIELIRSRTVMLPVVTNLHLAREWAEKYKEEGELPANLTYTLLSRSSVIKQIKGPHLIEVSVLSDDKMEAAAIANEIARVYTRSPLAARGANPDTAPQIIDEATPASRPAKPNKPLSIGTGLGLGLILSLIGIWLIGKSDAPKARIGGHPNRSTEQPPPLPSNEPSAGQRP